MPNKKTTRKNEAKANVSESVTLSVLAERIKSRLADKSLDDNKIKQIINSFFDAVRRDILDNGSFKLLGFGTFDRMLVDERERTDPSTGETLITPGHYKIKFVPVSALAKRINKPYEHLQPEVIEEAPAAEEMKTEANKASNDFSENQKESESPRDAFAEIDGFEEDRTDAPASGFYSEASPSYTPQTETQRRQTAGTQAAQKSLRTAIHTMPRPAPYEAPRSDDGFERRYAPDFAARVQSDPYEPRTEQRYDSFATPSSYDSADRSMRDVSGTSAVENQTVQHAVIQQQIIERQIVQQRVVQDRHTDEALETEEDIFDPDYDGDDYEEGIRRYINRCWFFAGIAVVLTVLMIGALVYVFTHRTPENTTVKSASQKPKTVVVEKVPERRIVSLEIAADDNLYAALAQAEYGERNLWPYIFSANMLRYPDPDNPGAARELIVPSKPDKAIDRRDIELSVIDVYDSYRSLIAANPRGRAAALRKEHAIIALICGESLYGGFIDKYAIRLDAEDVSTARERIKSAAH